ncbi:MAG: transposase, partial [Campylobacterales bacterium]
EICYENNDKGLVSLWGKIQKLYGKEAKEHIVLVFEPTASYGERLKKFAHDHGLLAFIVNPRQSANFAKALGLRNKNDTVDARMLSRIGLIAKPHEIAIPHYSDALLSLQEIMGYYRFLVKQKIATTNQLEAAKARRSHGFVIERLAKEIARLTEEIKIVMEQMHEVVTKDPELNEGYDAITSFKGIGPVGGVVLLYHFLRYPDANRREIIALAGLDVVTKESGSSVFRRGKISKRGSKVIRASLFMATLIAINHNHNIRQFYERLKSNGKHSTVAQIACMRKIILITHALFKKRERYNEAYGQELLVA